MRDQVTTILELAGLLVLNASATLAVARIDLPLALATCGVLLLGTSALIVATAPKRHRGQETT